MAMLDLLLEKVGSEGWLSISALYFDNAYNIFIPTTCGYVAYSKSQECFFSFNCMDTTDTDMVENTYATLYPRKHIGQQYVLTVVGSEHLQHFNMALYAQYRFLPYADKDIPYPKYPTEDQLNGLTKDPTTGLYNGCDTIITMANTERSTISLYKDTTDPNGDLYSGANVDAWKDFYANHKRFVTYLSNYMGVSDAI